MYQMIHILESRVFCLSKQDPLIFKGNWLLTSPVEDQMLWGMIQFEGSSVSSSFSKQLSVCILQIIEPLEKVSCR